MNKINAVTIIGLGLIGGSMALAWRRTRPSLRITAFDTPDVLEAALAAGAIDHGAASAGHAVEAADLVVIATPLSAIPGVLREIAGALSSGTVVTDTGSVKGAIAAVAGELLPDDVLFVGGHPMAGLERNGFEAADDLLFENASYVLCPPKGIQSDEFTSSAFVDLIRALGSRILLMDPAAHDEVAASISHLPQLLSVALVNSADITEQSMERNLAAGGFRDMTRIASSPFPMWRDILAANHGPVLDKLAELVSQIQRMRNRLIEEDYDALSELFGQAERARALISTDTKGFLSPLADLFVRVHDRPGELKQITAILFDNDINIKDLELLKIREGTGGTFRISFESEADSDRAAALLHKLDYVTRKP